MPPLFSSNAKIFIHAHENPNKRCYACCWRYNQPSIAARSGSERRGLGCDLTQTAASLVASVAPKRAQAAPEEILHDIDRVGVADHLPEP